MMGTGPQIENPESPSFRSCLAEEPDERDALGRSRCTPEDGSNLGKLSGLLDASAVLRYELVLELWRLLGPRVLPP
jgi:hypothetical protein